MTQHIKDQSIGIIGGYLKIYKYKEKGKLNNNFRLLCKAISSRSRHFHITNTFHITQCYLVAQLSVPVATFKHTGLDIWIGKHVAVS